MCVCVRDHALALLWVNDGITVSALCFFIEVSSKRDKDEKLRVYVSDLFTIISKMKRLKLYQLSRFLDVTCQTYRGRKVKLLLS